MIHKYCVKCCQFITKDTTCSCEKEYREIEINVQSGR